MIPAEPSHHMTPADPLSLQDQFVEATSPQLQAKVQMAIAQEAQTVAAEDTDTPNHNMRVQLAQQVARSPTMFNIPFTTMVVAQGITRNSNDADIQAQVTAVWDTMAGPTLTAPPPVPSVSGGMM